MAEYDNTNTGVLFKNDKKPEGSKQPDYKGTININGEEKELAAWVRDGKNGKKFMSLKISEPYKKGDTYKAVEQQREEPKDEPPF